MGSIKGGGGGKSHSPPPSGGGEGREGIYARDNFSPCLCLRMVHVHVHDLYIPKGHPSNIGISFRVVCQLGNNFSVLDGFAFSVLFSFPVLQFSLSSVFIFCTFIMHSLPGSSLYRGNTAGRVDSGQRLSHGKEELIERKEEIERRENQQKRHYFYQNELQNMARELPG